MCDIISLFHHLIHSMSRYNLVQNIAPINLDVIINPTSKNIHGKLANFILAVRRGIDTGETYILNILYFEAYK